MVHSLMLWQDKFNSHPDDPKDPCKRVITDGEKLLWLFNLELVPQFVVLQEGIRG